MDPNNGVQERDKFAFITKVLKEEQVPEPLRREAAGLLVASGWMHLLPGAEEAVRKLLKDEADKAKTDDFYTENVDLLTDGRG